MGQSIIKKTLPKALCPFVFAVTSKGRVAEGAIEILKLLPHEFVAPEDLHKIDQNENKKIFISIFESKDYVEHKEGKPFDKSDYYSNPENYKSIFHRYLDKVSFLVNCTYWEAKYPRVIYEDELH